MSGQPTDADSACTAGSLLQRLGEFDSVLDSASLQRTLAARIIAERIMCDPAYVLEPDERERLIGVLAVRNPHS